MASIKNLTTNKSDYNAPEQLRTQISIAFHVNTSISLNKNQFI